MQQYLTKLTGRMKLTLTWWITFVYTVYTFTVQFMVQTCDN